MKKQIVKYCNKVVNHTKWYRQYWNGVMKFWNMSRFNLDVVNLGSNSGLYAFDYEGLEISGMNWAIGPQSLVHDFNVLKNYFSYLRNGAVVLIPICPFSSLVSEYTKDSNLKYYTFLHPATVLDFDEAERVKALKIKQSPVREMPFLCVKNTAKEALRYVFPRKIHKCDMEENASMFLNNWKKQFGISNLDETLSEQHQNDQKNRIQVLQDMIDFCLDRNLKPVLVVPPVFSALGRKLTSTCRENYLYSFIRKANVKGVPILDYMDDDRFQDEKYFRNSFFMSEAGAKMFTRTILTEIGLL